LAAPCANVVGAPFQVDVVLPDGLEQLELAAGYEAGTSSTSVDGDS
jgi:hypothetical protein